MAEPALWLEILAGVKALAEATKAGVDVYAVYNKNLKDRDTNLEAERVSVQFASTFNDREVEAFNNGIKHCMDKNADTLDGHQRVRCICRILEEAKIGNGGKLPLIDDWQKYWNQLCRKTSMDS